MALHSRASPISRTRMAELQRKNKNDNNATSSTPKRFRAAGKASTNSKPETTSIAASATSCDCAGRNRVVFLAVACICIVLDYNSDLLSWVSDSLVSTNSSDPPRLRATISSSSESSSSSQLSSMSRKPVPLKPERRLLRVPYDTEEHDRYPVADDEVEYFFQLPPSASSLADVKGVVLLFHGCTHDGIDWFQLPEERRIVGQTLLPRGFAVVSISSQDRTNNKCWNPNFGVLVKNPDANRIVHTLPQLWAEMDPAIYKSNNNNSYETPWPRLFGIGASSGGDFLSIFRYFLPMRGINVMISPGNTAARKGSWDIVSKRVGNADAELHHKKQHQVETDAVTSKKTTHQFETVPHIAFVYMPRDQQYGSYHNIEEIAVNSLKRENGDHDVLVKTFTCSPMAATVTMLMEHMGATDAMHVDVLSGHAAYLTKSEAETFIQGLGTLNALDSSTHLLTKNPRSVWPRIEHLIRDVIKARQSGDGGGGGSAMERLMIESLREILNVAYAEHELTSEHAEEVVDFWLTTEP